MSGETSIEDYTTLQVIDRSFMPGTVVASVDHPEGEMGMTVDTKILFTLEWTKEGGEEIQAVDVPSTFVQPYISSVLPNMLAMRIKDDEKGIGVITHIYGDVIVRLDNGAICKAHCPTPSNLKLRNRDEIDDTMLEDAEEHMNMLYRPGDKVYARNDWWIQQEFVRGEFEPSKTVTGGRKKRPLSDGVVLRVETTEALVEWLASSHLADGEGFDRSEVRNM